jgi:hypothetical protein
MLACNMQMLFKDASFLSHTISITLEWFGSSTVSFYFDIDAKKNMRKLNDFEGNCEMFDAWMELLRRSFTFLPDSSETELDHVRNVATISLISKTTKKM